MMKIVSIKIEALAITRYFYLELKFLKLNLTRSAKKMKFEMGFLLVLVVIAQGRSICTKEDCADCVAEGCWFCGGETPICVVLQSNCPNGSSILIPPHSISFCPVLPPSPSIIHSSFYFLFFVVVMTALTVLCCCILLVFGYYRLAHYIARNRYENRRVAGVAAAHNFERLEAVVARQRLEEAVERGDVEIHRGTRRRHPAVDENVVPGGLNPLMQVVEEIELGAIVEMSE